MIEFVFYSSISDLVLYYSREVNNALYTELLNPTMNRIQLQQWSDLLQLATNNENLFGMSDELIIADYSSLQLEPKILDQLSRMQTPIRIILINRESPKSTPSLKKILTTHSIKHKIIEKHSNSDIEHLFDSYDSVRKIPLSAYSKSLIKKSSQNIDEIIALLYIADLLEDEQKLKSYITSHITQPAKPLYMVPFGENSLKEDTRIWAQSCSLEEIQLALSLLVTKSLKFRSAPLRSTILKYITKCDYNLKNFNRSEKNVFFGMLWKIRELA